jgi:cobalamin biosynthesis Mg chelatase CobN
MNGKRHRWALRRGRSTFGLVSVLALLALGCFPVLSQADSAQDVYEEARLSPTPKGSEIPTRTNPPAHVSQTEDAKSAGGESPGSQGGGSEKNPSEAGRGSGTHDGKGQGSPTEDATSQNPPSGQPIDSSGAGQESDSSSPLVPILIAAAILAAISIGVVVFRQRRQSRGPDAQASPEAS